MLSLHLPVSVPSDKADPKGTSPSANGAPRRCTCRAARRALRPSKGAAPDLQRLRSRFYERRGGCTWQAAYSLALLGASATYKAPCGACPCLCTALAKHRAVPSARFSVRVWCVRAATLSSWRVCAALCSHASCHRARITAIPACAHDLHEALGKPGLSTSPKSSP